MTPCQRTRPSRRACRRHRGDSDAAASGLCGVLYGTYRGDFGDPGNLSRRHHEPEDDELNIPRAMSAALHHIVEEFERSGSAVGLHRRVLPVADIDAKVLGVTGQLDGLLALLASVHAWIKA